MPTDEAGGHGKGVAVGVGVRVGEEVTVAVFVGDEVCADTCIGTYSDANHTAAVTTTAMAFALGEVSRC